MKGNNPFEDALKGFKAKKKFDAEEKAATDKKEESEPAPVSEPEMTQPEASHIDKEAEEEAEDEALFSELAYLIKLKKSDIFYYKIYRIITGSRKHDVAFDMNRFLKSRMEGCDNPRAKEIADMISRRGQISDAISWLKSLTPEGMKYGNGSRELRIENAQKVAKAARVSLETLIKENNLDVKL